MRTIIPSLDELASIQLMRDCNGPCDHWIDVNLCLTARSTREKYLIVRDGKEYTVVTMYHKMEHTLRVQLATDPKQLSTVQCCSACRKPAHNYIQMWAICDECLTIFRRIYSDHKDGKYQIQGIGSIIYEAINSFGVMMGNEIGFDIFTNIEIRSILYDIIHDVTDVRNMLYVYSHNSECDNGHNKYQLYNAHQLQGFCNTIYCPGCYENIMMCLRGLIYKQWLLKNVLSIDISQIIMRMFVRILCSIHNIEDW